MTRITMTNTITVILERNKEKYVPLKWRPQINSKSFTVSVSSPLPSLDNSANANFASNPPRSLSNSACASAILPCYITTKRNGQDYVKDEESERYRDKHSWIEVNRNFQELQTLGMNDPHCLVN